MELFEILKLKKQKGKKGGGGGSGGAFSDFTLVLPLMGFSVSASSVPTSIVEVLDLVGAEHPFPVRERDYSATVQLSLLLTHSYLTPSSSSSRFDVLHGALGIPRLDGLSTVP